ncbi:MAG: 7-cyano-7-deazaguanine synthase QueC [Pseudomonadota bacterium]
MRALDADKALVLFSGGQDSTVALAWALERYRAVETVGFAYGQRHAVELEARVAVRAAMQTSFPGLADRLGADQLIDLQGLGAISETALTRDAEIVEEGGGLPTTFVPGRNLVFLTLAGALAYNRGIGVLVGGMCETDFSGYPDCRRETLDAQLSALRLGMEADFAFETPLMRLTKAETWSLAERLGGRALVEVIVDHSHTCYRGDRATRHDWGYGCGTCPACKLRAEGWRRYVASR